MITLLPFKTRSLQSMLMTLLGVGFCSGCASFTQVGIRTVEHNPRRSGVVSEELVNYSPPKPLLLPTSGNPELKLKCEKTVRFKVKYVKPSHEERELRREITLLQKSLEDMYGKGSIIDKILWLPFLPIVLIEAPLLMDKRVETKYERISGSETTKASFRYEEKVVPAAGITLSIPEIGNCVTDDKGIGHLRGPPEKYDKGLRFTHGGSGMVYLIRRTKHQREVEYKAPWHDQAKAANILIGAGLTVLKVKNIVAVGGGPWAIAGAVIVDLVTGAIIGYIIDVAATETKLEVYYRWTIVSENRSESSAGG